MIVWAKVESVNNSINQVHISWQRGDSCKSGCGLCKASQDCKPSITGPFSNIMNYSIKEGDSVEVEFYSSSHIVPAFIMFFLPLVIFFISYALFEYTNIFISVPIISLIVLSYIIFLIKINKVWKKRVKGEVISVK